MHIEAILAALSGCTLEEAVSLVRAIDRPAEPPPPDDDPQSPPPRCGVPRGPFLLLLWGGGSRKTSPPSGERGPYLSVEAPPTTATHHPTLGQDGAGAGTTQAAHSAPSAARLAGSQKNMSRSWSPSTSIANSSTAQVGFERRNARGIASPRRP